MSVFDEIDGPKFFIKLPRVVPSKLSSCNTNSWQHWILVVCTNDRRTASEAMINDRIPFFRSLEDLIHPLIKKVGVTTNSEASTTASGSTPLDLILSGAKNQHQLYNNYVPRGPNKKARDPSPDLIEIQAQIEAIR